MNSSPDVRPIAILQAAFRSAPDAILLVDPQGVIHWQNGRARTLFEVEDGTPLEQVVAVDSGDVSRRLREVFSSSSPRNGRFSAALGQVHYTAWRVGLREHDAPLAVIRIDRSSALLSKFLALHREKEGGMARLALEKRRSGELRREAQRLRKLATEDRLTGLLNAGEFERCVRRRLLSPSVTGLMVFVDLNDFKTINDRHGHDAGDAALRRTGHVLAGALRSGDLAGRLGGDEFALWFDGVDPTEGMRRAGKVERELSLPWQVAPGVVLSFGGAFGIAHAPLDATDYARLKTIADQRMYTDKSLTKGRRRA